MSDINFGEPSGGGFIDTHFDFARCQRPDGSFYGTGGVCRKGSQVGAKEKEASSGKSGGSASKEKSATATAKASKDPAVQKRVLQTELKRVSAKYEKLRGKPEAAAERRKLMDRANKIVQKQKAVQKKIDKAASKEAGPKKPDTSLPAQQRRSSAAARARD